MTDEATSRNGPLDIQTIQTLAGLMSEHDLSEIILREGNKRLVLRRGHAPTLIQGSSVPALSMAAAPMPGHAAPTAPASPQAGSKPTEAAGKKLLEIKSQTVGTFYAKSNPDAPPFVRVGSRVDSSTVVGLIEAMKIFNEITAECMGTVAEILVENQQPVEFGQVLFRVDPA